MGRTFQWLPANIDLFAIGMGVAVVSVWAIQDDRLRRLADLVSSAGPSRGGPAAIVLFVWYAYRVGPADLDTSATPGGSWQQRQAHRRRGGRPASSSRRCSARSARA